MCFPFKYFFYIIIFTFGFFISCNDKSKKDFSKIEVKSFNNKVADSISSLLDFTQTKDGKFNDSQFVLCHEAVMAYYKQNSFQPIWSDSMKWLPASKDFIAYLDSSVTDGLFNADYDFNGIHKLFKKIKKDSLFAVSPLNWAQADILFTGAFIKVLRDLKQGRLQNDSLSWENVPDKYGYFFNNIDSIVKGKKVNNVFQSAQPLNTDYLNLKIGLRKFLDSMDGKIYTYIKYPYDSGNLVDSLLFVEKIHRRFIEEGFKKYSFIKIPDSLMLAEELSWYRKKNKLPEDAISLALLINQLNLTDHEKLIRIAITLDKYKHNDSLPSKYICVNLPAYHVRIKENDSVKFFSKIICGKPSTRTPLLKSAINEIITFPTWTVPESIISKEMLPGLKKNINYLNKKGLYLLDNKGVKIDPTTVDWLKYKNYIPYKIQQGSGESNALGVIKFNFPNEHAVYLHDTNQRYLFQRSNRALSHGCVRVQDWKELAFYLIKNDSLSVGGTDSLRYNTDSIENWIVKKQRHRVSLKNPMPLYIWYFTCEGINGLVKFYSDIYEEDKVLREKYFAHN